MFRIKYNEQQQKQKKNGAQNGEKLKNKPKKKGADYAQATS